MLTRDWTKTPVTEHHPGWGRKNNVIRWERTKSTSRWCFCSANNAKLQFATPPCHLHCPSPVAACALSSRGAELPRKPIAWPCHRAGSPSPTRAQSRLDTSPLEAIVPATSSSSPPPPRDLEPSFPRAHPPTPLTPRPHPPLSPPRQSPRGHVPPPGECDF